MMENESKLKFILYSGHDVSRKFFLFSNLNYHCLYKGSGYTTLPI